MRNQKQQYGSFKVNSKNVLRSKMFVAVFALLALGGSYYGYQKVHHKNISGASVMIPQASASEIPGWWLHDYFGSSICNSLNCQPQSDPDGDKLTNAQEFYYNSNPMKKDTNGNGLSDGDDVAQGYDPSKPGKVSFEQAASDDEIFGESMLYQNDVSNIISNMVDPTKVTLPEISDAELTIIPENTKISIATYLGRIDQVNSELFPKDMLTTVSIGGSALSDADIQTIKEHAITAIATYKKIPVPSDAVQFQKYSISLMMVLPDVIQQPTEDQFNDVTNQISEHWYNQVQAYSAILQKLNLQETILRNKYDK